MRRLRSILAVALVAIAVLALAAPVSATESHDEGDTTETTVTTEPTFAGDPPVVVAPAAEVDEEELPWTARFIYPTIAVVAVLLVAGLAIGYNRSIRKKFTVVD